MGRGEIRVVLFISSISLTVRQREKGMYSVKIGGGSSSVLAMLETILMSAQTAECTNTLTLSKFDENNDPLDNSLDMGCSTWGNSMLPSVAQGRVAGPCMQSRLFGGDEERGENHQQNITKKARTRIRDWGKRNLQQTRSSDDSQTLS